MSLSIKYSAIYLSLSQSGKTHKYIVYSLDYKDCNWLAEIVTPNILSKSSHNSRIDHYPC